ncbi:GNAT family N-acetyltransferase [Mesorhizobium sp. SB112]|uniref:GNAT family N-acetyltransferase n=1 Tax=Mesorhizobium sp. SB112 TaxID=3151853 RepID=UPI0032659BDF
MWQIRQFEEADIDKLYAISLTTGHLGNDASHLYADPNMMGHLYAGGYATLEPTLVLLLTDEDGVAGFALGAVDTFDWEARLEQDWWPALRKRYADPSDTPKSDWTADERRAHMIHHPTTTPSDVIRTFPAHLHMNFLTRAQGQGQGRRLLNAWVELAAGRGVRAIHVGANRNNHRAMSFWQRSEFVPVFDLGRTVWMGRQF